MESYIDKKFTRLTVLKEVDPIPDKHGKNRIAYLCLCDCGNEIITTRHQLQNKNGIKSCGCLNTENRSKLGLSKRKLPPHLASAKIIFCNSYADGNLLFEDFIKITAQNCYYCDSVPSNIHNKYLHRDKWGKNSQFAKDNGMFIYNGLDRIKSSEPHNLDNVVPCCWQCNIAKSNFSSEEFKQHIQKIYNHWAKETA